MSYTAMNGVAVPGRDDAPIRHASHPASERLRGRGGGKPSALQQSERIAGRYGAGRVLTAGLGARWLLLACLACLGHSQAPWAGVEVLVAFSLVQMVWPLLAVSANALSVELVPAARGESIGLFNAATAVASSLESAIGESSSAFTGFQRWPPAPSSPREWGFGSRRPGSARRPMPSATAQRRLRHASQAALARRGPCRGRIECDFRPRGSQAKHCRRR
jgi:hypothetical protein